MRAIVASALVLTLVAACEPLSDDVPGQVVSFTDTMVVIEAYGGFHQDDYKRPPTAMQANAQSLCESRNRSAKFLNANLKDTGARTITGPFGTSYVSGSQSIAPVQYRFACL